MDDNKYDEQLGDMAEEDNSVPDIENNENTPDIEDNENTPEVEDDDYTPEVEDDDYTPEVVDDDNTPDVEDETEEADAENKDVTVDEPVLSGRKRKKKEAYWSDFVFAGSDSGSWRGCRLLYVSAHSASGGCGGISVSCSKA